MVGGSNKSRYISVALLATLLLRASIPDGYMPAPVGGGLLFELCPAGVPAELMQALAGPGTHHHHHDSNDTSGAQFDAEQCPIGNLLSAAVAIDAHWITPDVPLLTEPPVAAAQVVASRSELARRSRGPPA